MVETWTADLELALGAVRAAARPIMDAFGTEPEVRHKGPDQPVTDADLEADAVLKERLAGARPGYGWLSEESVDRPERLERDRVWIVDPIDGTRSYIAGYREFAVSVALAERGRPVIGVIYNPARDRLVWALADGGAYAAGAGDDGTDRRLELTAGSAGRTILASRTERADGEFEPFAGDWTIREVGSTAWTLAGVALGWGAYISRGPKSEWDVAAGVLIVEEAGGVVTDVGGRAIGLNRRKPYVHGVVAGPPDAHARLLARARELSSPRLRGDAWTHDGEG